MRMNGAREVTKSKPLQLYHVVQDMAMVAQIPCPVSILWIDPSMNAFATGSILKMRLLQQRQVSSCDESRGIGGSYRTRRQPYSQYDIRISTLQLLSLPSAITMLSGIGGRMIMVGRWP